MALKSTGTALLLLVALSFRSGAHAKDNPACAQYQESMAYNACLARHGPKANDIATRPTHRNGGRAAPGRSERAEDGKATTRTRPWLRAMRNHERVHMEFPVK
jgi:hypothetical protein